MSWWEALLLGLLEGLTEFIPVSSTGHILLAGHFLGVSSPGKAFEVLIQLGAILAIVTIYFRKLWDVAMTLPSREESRRFVLAVFVAFLPAAVMGVVLHPIIKGVLFETPMLISIMLLVGGVILLFVDRLKLEPRTKDVMQITPGLALKIGLCQCLALVPGVSRSGSTIVGALLMGVDKRTAAEFSFYLAMPTMAGAFAYDAYKNWDALSGAAWGDIAIGFVTAFVAGFFVVRFVLDYVSRRGFALFGWWRIIVGAASLIALVAMG
jgi:undecaprenyl-diphosphatase